MTEIFNWIAAIINSCTDDFHFEAVDKLIEIFDAKFNNEELSLDLKTLRAVKWNDIHGIIEPTLNK
jgi:hypothetical protein